MVLDMPLTCLVSSSTSLSDTRQRRSTTSTRKLSTLVSSNLHIICVWECMSEWLCVYVCVYEWVRVDMVHRISMQIHECVRWEISVCLSVRMRVWVCILWVSACVSERVWVSDVRLWVWELCVYKQRATTGWACTQSVMIQKQASAYSTITIIDNNCKAKSNVVHVHT
jgi:hypothetical protein